MATSVSRTDKPHRVQQRPAPSQWEDHELMTLAEAAALFWPDGPLTVRSLRTAVRDEVLPVTWIAGKIFTTPESIRLMSRPKKSASKDEAPVPPDQKTSATPTEKPPTPAAALLSKIAEHRRRLKPAHSRPPR